MEDSLDEIARGEEKYPLLKIFTSVERRNFCRLENILEEK